MLSDFVMNALRFINENFFLFSKTLTAFDKIEQYNQFTIL